MSVYVSTGGFYNLSADKTAELFVNENIKFIELSGGLYSKDLLINLSKYIESGVKFQIHNYFPPPKNPFILNLASSDDSIRKQSLNHVMNSLKCCKILKSNFYSFHAGFLCDFSISEIGKKIKNRQLNDRKKSKDIFYKSLEKISKVASDLNINLMIENNVLSKKNFLEFNSNPFLMCDPEEAIEIMKDSPKNINLLVDVAHLKVSSNSLRFDPKNFFLECDDYITGYHLSDNDGLVDSNNSINENSWFWRYLKKDIDYISLEVYGEKISQLNELKKLVESKCN